MFPIDTSSLCCPSCRGSVARVRRSFDGTDFVASLFADWPFWALFFICSAIGMFSVIAGVIAAGGALIVFVAYVQARARFRCGACAQVFRLAELASKDGPSKNGV